MENKRETMGPILLFRSTSTALDIFSDALFVS